MNEVSLRDYIESKIDGIDDNIREIKGTLEKINGRIGRSEETVKMLQNEVKDHSNNCIYREDIMMLKSEFAANKTVREFIVQQSKSNEEKDQQRNRWTVVLIAGISLIFTIATFVIYFTADYKIGTP